MQSSKQKGLLKFKNLQIYAESSRVEMSFFTVLETPFSSHFSIRTE